MKSVTIERIAGMNCHYRFYTLSDFFAGLQRNGITHAELWTCPSHFLLDAQHWQDTRAVRDLARQYEITIICLTPEQNNPKPHNLAAKDPELIERTYRYFCNAVCAAAELECNLLSVSSGWGFYSEPRAEAWKRSAEMLYRVAEYAHTHGVCLAMETLLPRETTLVRTLTEAKEMLRTVGSQGLKLNLDLGSMAAAGETVEQWFAACGAEIVHCHFVDGNPTGHLAWGEGNRNPGEDLNVFAQNDYLGFFSLELLSPEYYQTPWLAEQKSLKALSPWLETTGKEGYR